MKKQPLLLKSAPYDPNCFIESSPYGPYVPSMKNSASSSHQGKSKGFFYKRKNAKYSDFCGFFYKEFL